MAGLAQQTDNRGLPNTIAGQASAHMHVTRASAMPTDVQHPSLAHLPTENGLYRGYFALGGYAAQSTSRFCFHTGAAGHCPRDLSESESEADE